MPGGVVAEQVIELQKKFTDERSQASRDVAIESFKLADVNTKFYLSTGLTLEQLELNHWNGMQNRALQAERSIVEFGIALFNTKVQRYNTLLARYQAKATEVESRIRIQSLKMEQFKTELAKAETLGNLDKVKISNYEARLKSHDAIVNLYEAEVRATVAAMNIERAKVEIYKADIDAYIANINAQRNEYDLFAARIDGEKAKIDLHRSEVEAYATRVNAVKVSNSVVIEKIKSDIALEELNLKAHLGNVDIWKAKAQMAIQELSIEDSFYNADISKFREEVRKEMGQAELNITSLDRGMKLELHNAEIKLQTAIANTNAIIEQSKNKNTASQGTSAGYNAMASMSIGAIQTMLQLAGQGISNEYIDTT